MVETIAIQEQDKVVAACATSALWAFLNASKQVSLDQMPSPSSITKSAIPSDSEGIRTFPNNGLTPGQVARSLKSYGLEPTIFTFGESGIDKLSNIMELIFAYTSNDIPVLLGGKVFKKSEASEIEFLGEHLICVLGYKTNASFSFDKTADLKIKAHSIEKIYVHDDRYGPFARIGMKTETWEDSSTDKTYEGLLVSKYFETEDLFVPDLVMIGLYHKIRIAYPDISTICRAFDVILKSYISNGFEESDSKLQAALEKFVSGVCEITLVTNTEVKEGVACCKKWKSSSFGNKKKYLLEKHLPKYLWRCKYYCGDKLFTELYFDATEVPQGKLLIGFSSFEEGASLLWQFISNEIKEASWSIFYDMAEDDQKSAVSCFIRYFSVPDKDISLDLLYGPANLARRSLKPGEFDHFRNIQRRVDLIRISREGTIDLDSLSLNKKDTYIWVINKYGDLILGEDIQDGGEFQGHPTLVDGEPARIGGELTFSPDKNKWLINTKSRTYSGHLTDQKEQGTYLENIKKNMFESSQVEIELLS